jgi:trehalose 2-sulfotransferase
VAAPLVESPEWDTSPSAADAPPAHPYVVRSTPRSGSNLLCFGLLGTGLVGSPFEYFNDDHRPQLERLWGCDGSLLSYTRALYGRRTTAEGLFGLKLHWDQVTQVRAEALGGRATEPEYGVSADVLERLLPGARYVRVLRRDVYRQAVSYWVATVTDRWRIPHGRPPTDGRPIRAHYDFEGIERCRRLIENGEVHWDRLVRAKGVEPLTVVYEELCADYAGTIRAVVRALRPDAGEIDVGPPVTARLSDAASEELLRRYARDRERHGLPPPL